MWPTSELGRRETEQEAAPEVDRAWRPEPAAVAGPAGAGTAHEPAAGGSSAEQLLRITRPHGGRLFTVTLVATVAIASSAGTVLVLGDRVVSRAEAVANAVPGVAAPATAAVERRPLSDTFAFRASLQAGSSKKVALPQSLAGVVTRVLCSTKRAPAFGAAVLEVQGRPVFVLPGRFPYYRDLRPGDRGPDVEQLQAAMASLGLPVKREYGVFGARTQRALTRFYAVRGWSPPVENIVSGDTAGQEPSIDGPAGGTAASASGSASAPAPAPVQASTPALGRSRSAPVTASTPAATAVVARAAELWSVAGPLPKLRSVDIRVGMTLGSAPAQLGTYAATARLSGQMPAGRSNLIEDKTGVLVEVDGRSVPGRLAAAEEEADAPRADSLPVGVELPAEVRVSGGRSYKVIVQGAHTDGPVLAVPVTAVNGRADGSSFVARREVTGHVTDVNVRAGIETQGWVQVEAIAPATLKEGDFVVVGVQPDHP